MKEFNLILDKVSQALNMSVDNIVKIYPQLRIEYTWYYLLDNLQEVLGALILIVGCVGGIYSLLMIIDSYPDEDDYKNGVKVFKWSLGFEILFVLLFVVAFAFQGFMCPDILIIKNFIK